MKKDIIKELSDLLISNGFNNFTIEKNNSDAVYEYEMPKGVPVLKISSYGCEQYIIKITQTNLYKGEGKTQTAIDSEDSKN